jgi:integrase/recombinase XerD
MASGFRPRPPRANWPPGRRDIHPKLAQPLGEYDHGGHEYRFPGRHGRGWLARSSADWLLDQTVAYAGLAGLGISTHSFRRTALTQMSNAGAPAGDSGD